MILRRKSAQRHLCLLLGLLAFIASATSTAAETFHKSHLVRVYPTATGDFVLTFESDDANCTGNSPKYYRVRVGAAGVTVDGAKAMLATALTAKASGFMVGIYFDDSTSDCLINRLYIY